MLISKSYCNKLNYIYFKLPKKNSNIFINAIKLCGINNRTHFFSKIKKKR